MDHKMHDATRIIHAGRNPKEQGWMVNPPIYQSSTIVFPTYQDFLYGEQGYSNNDLVKPYELKYGHYGTQSNFAIEKAIAEIENGYNTFVTSSGKAAVYMAIMAFAGNGDHMLMVDNAYSPTRSFCNNFINKFGVETTFYDPYVGADIEKLIKPNTKVIFMESPGSLSYEVQDIKAICEVAKKHNIVTIVDNSWASGIYFKPLNHGADISLMAVTKYINGHSDIMMGAVTVQERHFKTMYNSFRHLGVVAAPFNCYLAQRGLRTVKVRMDQSAKTALEIATWLEQRPEVAKVLYPALPSSKDHALWKRDFTGAASVFSIVLNKKYSPESMSAMLDGLQLHSMGYSWGGYETLILPINIAKVRTATSWNYGDNTAFRISVGLEDVNDLREDLEAGLNRLKASSANS
jgi:cystathionine beta-lyase